MYTEKVVLSCGDFFSIFPLFPSLRSLLKLWYRELWDPLIPEELYQLCVERGEETEEVIEIVNTKLPEIDRLVLTYLIRFLQVSDFCLAYSEGVGDNVTCRSAF